MFNLKKALMISALLVSTLIFMASCGSGDKYTIISDDPENVSLLMSSSIGDILPDSFDGYEEMSDYSQMDPDEPIPDSPWIVVKQEYSDGKYEYIPVATSEETFDESTISATKVLGVYSGHVNSADYANSAGGRAKVTTEAGSIRYFEAATGKMIGYDTISPEELPEETSGNRDYTIGDKQIADTVVLRIESQVGSRYYPDEFTENGEGELSGVDFEKIYTHRNGENILRVPKKFTKISKNAFTISYDNYNSKWYFDYYDIPDTVTEIDKEAWPSTNGLVLIVGQGSVAEKYAKENLIMYAYREKTMVVNVPDGVSCWYMPLTFVEVDKYRLTDSVKSVSEYTAERFAKSHFEFKIEAPKGSFMAKFVKKNAPNMLIEK